MPTIRAYAAKSAQSQLAPLSIERREPRPDDVEIEVLYCGVCHSDIHQARDEWGGSIFPMVPGHEVVGKVTRVGSKVTRFKVGDTAGVGCLVDSCGTCASCASQEEQFCQNGFVGTYNSLEKDGKTPTYGGYSARIVVKEAFTLKIAPHLPLERVAPLLCAGITTYSPLRHWKVGPGKKVAIAGLGGLGHMGVKLAVSMGAEVTVLSTSEGKEKDVRALGAHGFIHVSQPEAFEKNAGRFDFILNTVSAKHDLNAYLGLLKANGTMVLVGAPEKPGELHAFSLIGGRKSLAGSLIGGIKETQEMLDYCAQKNVLSDVEVIPIQKINEAYERMLRGDVRYRFVIDIGTLNK